MVAELGPNEYWVREEAEAKLQRFIDAIRERFGYADITDEGDYGFSMQYRFNGALLILNLDISQDSCEWPEEGKDIYCPICNVHVTVEHKAYGNIDIYLGDCTFDRKPSLFTIGRRWKNDFDLIEMGVDIAKRMGQVF